MAWYVDARQLGRLSGETPLMHVTATPKRPFHAMHVSQTTVDHLWCDGGMADSAGDVWVRGEESLIWPPFADLIGDAM